MLKNSGILFLISVLSLFTSCDSKRLFEENIDINNHSWHKDSVLTFTYTTDSIVHPKALSFAFNVRNTVDFEYRNLWLFVEINFPNKTVIKDTLNLFLMDEQGFWLNNVKGGSIKESRHYYKFALTRPPKGNYTIKIKHGMREEYLNEVVSVGARVEKIE